MIKSIKTILSYAMLCMAGGAVVVVFVPAGLITIICAAILWTINQAFCALDFAVEADMKAMLDGESGEAK